MRDVILLRQRGTNRPLRLSIERCLEIVRAIEPSGDALVIDEWRHEAGGLALLQISAPDAAERVKVHAAPELAFAYTGFVAQDGFHAADVLRRVRLGEGTLEMTDSPGGIAAYFLADGARRRLWAWSSYAGVQAVFYTETPDLTVVSNRPLLSHLCARGTTRPEMSRLWARRVLAAGSTLWDDTPFEGTFYLRPRSLLVVGGGGVEVHPHPLLLQRTRYGDRSGEGLEAFLDATQAAVAPLRRFPLAELHLSGGKDSRFVAALVAHCALPVDPVTYSTSVDAGEAPVARRVAEHLGLRHRLGSRGVAAPEALLATVLANLRKSDGLLAECRQLCYQDIDLPRGRPFLQGQAHHPRGGYNVPITKSYARVVERLAQGQLGDADLVVDELVKERWFRVGELLAGYADVRHPIELAYWLYADWRPPRWTHASYLADTRDRPVVWPCMDERVLRVLAELSGWDKQSEWTLFGALKRMAPGIERVPLFIGEWHFDRGGRAHSEYPEGYEERYQSVPSRPGRSADRRPSYVWPLFRQVLSDVRAGEVVKEQIRPAVLASLLESEAKAMSLDAPRERLTGFMWRALAVALVLDGQWLSMDRTAIPVVTAQP